MNVLIYRIAGLKAGKELKKLDKKSKIKNELRHPPNLNCRMNWVLGIFTRSKLQPFSFDSCLRHPPIKSVWSHSKDWPLLNFYMQQHSLHNLWVHTLLLQANEKHQHHLVFPWNTKKKNSTIVPWLNSTSAKYFWKKILVGIAWGNPQKIKCITWLHYNL